MLRASHFCFAPTHSPRSSFFHVLTMRRPSKQQLEQQQQEQQKQQQQHDEAPTDYFDLNVLKG